MVHVGLGLNVSVLSLGGETLEVFFGSGKAVGEVGRWVGGWVVLWEV